MMGNEFAFDFIFSNFAFWRWGFSFADIFLTEYIVLAAINEELEIPWLWVSVYHR